jgi:hypothetical protein
MNKKGQFEPADSESKLKSSLDRVRRHQVWRVGTRQET